MWEVPVGNDRRLEGSHLRCTGLQGGQRSLCSPSPKQMEKRKKQRDGGEEKKVKGMIHESGGGAGSQRERGRRDGEADTECLFLPLFCGQNPHCG